MTYKKYDYGTKKIEIRKLLRERLKIKDKIRYSKKKVSEFEGKLLKIEEKLNLLLQNNGHLNK